MGHRSYTEKDLDELCKQYSNWGRWGSDDELGTTNFITPDCVIAAAQLVQTGQIISVGLPYDNEGPQTGAFGRNNPLHLMLQHGGDIALRAQTRFGGRFGYTDDALFLPLQSGTQWDALGHIFDGDKMYNGLGLEHVTSDGAAKNAIHLQRDRLVGRGVLLDIPKFRGDPWVELGDSIDSAELAACADSQGVEVRRGDILLVRTGHMARVRSNKDWEDYAAGDAPGLSLDSAHFLCGREIGAVATDTWGVEVRPNEIPGMFQPLHLVLIVHAGLTLGEIFDFERLAVECASLGRYEFMFAGPPLPITGAVGSPLNPLCIL